MGCIRVSGSAYTVNLGCLETIRYKLEKSRTKTLLATFDAPVAHMFAVQLRKSYTARLSRGSFRLYLFEVVQKLANVVVKVLVLGEVVEDQLARHDAAGVVGEPLHVVQQPAVEHAAARARVQHAARRGLDQAVLGGQEE